MNNIVNIHIQTATPYAAQKRIGGVKFVCLCSDVRAA